MGIKLKAGIDKKSLNEITADVSKALHGSTKGLDPSKIDAFVRPLGKITGQANEFQKSMAASNARVIAFGASVAIIGGVTKSFERLLEVTIRVEKTFADINVVLGANKQELKRFGNGIFDVAKQTAQSFDIVAEGALEFARQGLGMEESLRRIKDALILTRLTGLDVTESVMGLTAAVNAFSKTGITTSQVINKLAEVDVKFAVGSADLIRGIERAGSIAQDTGVSFEELTAMITALQEKTARGGAVIGNSLKSIFSRIRRNETIESLKDLGIKVTDVNGKILSSTDLLKNLADRLNDTKRPVKDFAKNAIFQKVGGLFQINQLIALLDDLGSETSRYASSLEIANRETLRAYQKNQQLNETIDALIKKTGVAGQQLATLIGNLGFKENITKIFQGVNSAIDFLINILDEEKGEGMGGKFARGVIKGIGGALTSTPVLGLFAAIVAKLSYDLAKFGIKGLQSLFGMNRQAEQQRSLQSSILHILEQQPKVLTLLQEASGRRLGREQILLSILKSQEATYRSMYLTAASMGKNLFGAGARATPAGIVSKIGARPTFAEGYIPEQNSIRKGVGGAPAHAKPVDIPNFNFGGGKRGSVVANTSEYLVPNFMGSGGSAIYNKNMAKTYGLPRGAKKITRGFSVPNFARIPLLTKAVGRVVTNSIRPVGYRVGAHTNRLAKGSELNLALDGPTTGFTKNLWDIFWKGLVRDKPIRRVFPRGWGQDDSTSKIRDFAFRKMFGLEPRYDVSELLRKNPSGTYSFRKGTYQYDSIVQGDRFGGGGTKGDGNSGLGHGVMGGYTRRVMQNKKGNEYLRYKDRWDFDLNRGEEITLGQVKRAFRDWSDYYKLLRKDGIGRQEAAQLSFNSLGNAEGSTVSRLLRMLVSKVTSPITFKGSAAEDPRYMLAGGYLPNPLGDAIRRERSAGLPISQIRINQSGKLRNASNPKGLAVTNVRDEPTGRIPNYAKYPIGGIRDPQTGRFAPKTLYGNPKIKASPELEASQKRMAAATLRNAKDLEKLSAAAKKGGSALELHSREVGDSIGKIFALQTVAFGLTAAFQGAGDEATGWGQKVSQSLTGLTSSLLSLSLITSAFGGGIFGTGAGGGGKNIYSRVKAISAKGPHQRALLKKLAGPTLQVSALASGIGRGTKGAIGAVGKALPGIAQVAFIGAALNSLFRLIDKDGKSAFERIFQSANKASEGLNDFASSLSGKRSISEIILQSQEASIREKLRIKGIDVSKDESAIRAEELREFKKDRPAPDKSQIKGGFRKFFEKRLSELPSFSGMIGSPVGQVPDKNSLALNMRIEQANKLEAERQVSDLNSAIQSARSKLFDGFEESLFNISEELEAGKVDKSKVSSLIDAARKTFDKIQNDIIEGIDEARYGADDSIISLPIDISTTEGIAELNSRLTIAWSDHLEKVGKEAQNEIEKITRKIVQQIKEGDLIFVENFKRQIEDAFADTERLIEEIAFFGTNKKYGDDSPLNKLTGRKGAAEIERSLALDVLTEKERLLLEQEQERNSLAVNLAHNASQYQQGILNKILADTAKLESINKKDAENIIKKIKNGEDFNEIMESALIFTQKTSDLGTETTEAERELLDIYDEEVKAAYDKVTALEKDYEQQKKILKIRQEIARQTIEPRGARHSFEQGLNELKTSAQLMDSLFKQIPVEFSNSLANAMQTAINETEGLRESLMSIGRDFLLMIQKSFLQMAANNITFALGNTFGLKVPGAAKGGIVTGGSGVRDDVPRMLTGGEYVLKKAAVNKYGLNYLESLNARTLPTFYEGGLPISQNSQGKYMLGDRVPFEGKSFFEPLTQAVLSSKYNGSGGPSISTGVGSGTTGGILGAGLEDDRIQRFAGGGFFVPGQRGQGEIRGEKDLQAFIDQRVTSGSQDRFLRGEGIAGIDLEAQSKRLTTFGLTREDSPMLQYIMESQQKAQGLLDDKAEYERQKREQEKLAKKALIQSLIGTVLSAGLAAGAGALAKNIQIGKVAKEFGLSKGDVKSFLKYSSSTDRAKFFEETGKGNFKFAHDLLGLSTYPSRQNLAPSFPTFSGPSRSSLDFNALQRTMFYRDAVDADQQLFRSLGLPLGGGAKGGSFKKGSALLTGGEFVAEPKTVQRYGEKFFESINNMTAPMPRMAMGGPIGPMPTGKSDGDTNISIVVNSESGNASTQSGGANREQDTRMADKIRKEVVRIIEEEKRVSGAFSTRRRGV